MPGDLAECAAGTVSHMWKGPRSKRKRRLDIDRFLLAGNNNNSVESSKFSAAVLALLMGGDSPTYYIVSAGEGYPGAKGEEGVKD